MWVEECTGDGLRTSLDKPTEKNKTHPMGFFISIPISLQTAQSVPGHTERGIFHKLRNPQVAAMRGFSKTCQNTSTFPTAAGGLLSELDRHIAIS